MPAQDTLPNFLPLGRQWTQYHTPPSIIPFSSPDLIIPAELPSLDFSVATNSAYVALIAGV